MKNIIAAIATLLVLSLAFLTFSKGGAYHGGEHGKVIKDFENTKTTSKKKDLQKDQGADELSALRDKAGNAGSFKVSLKYKSKCASCHGSNGSGFQNGRAMMGSKLFGQSEEEILKSLIDFQDGRKENIVMRGLLISLDRDALEEFAKEIGEFPARAEALNNK